MSEANSTGFFGKMPSRGDFLQRGLPATFVDPWDDWLAHSIAASRAALGGAWLDAYLTSPIWRFAIGRGVIDANIWTGAMMPSVDRVNRYFPLVIVTQVTETANPFDLLDPTSDWFQRVEDLLLQALDRDDLDLDDYASSIADLGGPIWAPDNQAQAARLSLESDGATVNLPDGVDIRSASSDLLIGLLKQQFGAITLWWTTGSENVQPTLRVFSGLPSSERFKELLADPGATIKPMATGQPLPPEVPIAQILTPTVPVAETSAQSSAETQVEILLEKPHIEPLPDFNQMPTVGRSDAGTEPAPPDLPPGKTGTILDALDSPEK